MRLQRRSLTPLRLVASVATLLCTILPTSASTTTIELWHSFRGKEEQGLTIAVKAFNLQHENQIRLVAKDGQKYPEETEKAILSSRGPDILIWAHDPIGAWVKKGMLAPLDAYADSALLDQYLPNCLKALRHRGALYGLPLSFESLIMYYNRDLVPTPPINTDDLIRIGKSITDPAAGRYGIVYDRTNFYFHGLWLHGFGGRLFNDGGNLDFLSPGMVRSLEFARDLAKVHGIFPDEPVNYDTAMQYFNSGKAGILLNGPWAYGGIDRAKVNLGTAVLPFITESNEWASPFLGVKGLYVSARSPRKQAAFEAIAFLTSAYSSSIMNIMAAYLPANRHAYEQSIVADNPFTASCKEQLLSAVPMPAEPRMIHVWKAMNGEHEKGVRGCLERALLDGVEPREALQLARQDFLRRSGGRP